MMIRRAVPDDAEGITRVYLDSAEHHARLNPERYYVPPFDAIAKRYRNGEQHPGGRENDAVTLVAEDQGEIVGFIDAQLERPHDAMHRPAMFCFIAEVAVLDARRSEGIGENLLLAAEAWGREHGAEFAALEYLTANTRAAQFYHERLGYSAGAVVAFKRL